jgi:glycosyltransferase involved in cell wall biosynthesis
MLLSVIIPIGNLERDYRNLNKIIKSTPKEDVELSFVLDTDEKTAFLELNQLCQNENLVHYKISFCSARNPGSSRNIGSKVAEGKWIIFCDSDDMPLFHNLLTAINKSDNESNIVIGSFVNENRFGIQARAELIENNPTLNWQSIALNPGIWRWLIRKNYVENILFPDLSIGEDQFFLIKLLSCTSKVQFSSQIFYVYRSDIQGSLTSDKAKLSDLSRNLKLEIAYIASIKNRKPIINNIILRQIVTLFKHGNIRLKLLAVALSIKFIVILSPSAILSVVKFAIQIIKGQS